MLSLPGIGFSAANSDAITEVVIEPFLPVDVSQALVERLTQQVGSELSDNENILLLERESLTALVDERALANSSSDGLDQSSRSIGIRGAKFLLGGSVLEHNGYTHYFGKLVRVSDGSMRAFSAKSRSDLTDTLAIIAASKAQSLIASWSPDRTNSPSQKISRMAALASSLSEYEKPTLSVDIKEEHSSRQVADRARVRAQGSSNNRLNGQPIDPAAETEFLVFSTESGFPVVDKDPRFEQYVDVLVLGEGFTEVSYRNGSALGVTARLEVKAISRTTGRMLAVDRQTSVVVAGSELIGSKDALAKAAAAVAERMLPKLVLASQ